MFVSIPVRLARFAFVVAGVLGAAGVATADGAATPTPTASPSPTASLLPDATAHLSYGQTQGSAKLTLAIGGLDPKTMSTDPLGTITDVTTSETTVGPISKKTLTVGTTTRIYQVTLPVSNLPKNTTQQQRNLAFTVAGSDKLVTYTLTNALSSTYGLALKGPPTGLAVRTGEWLAVGAVVGPQSLSGVKLLQPTVMEKTTRVSLAKPRLQLCQDAPPSPQPNSSLDPPARRTFKPSGPCAGEKGLQLNANSAAQLWLGPADAVGTYENQSISIASDQKPDGEALSLSIFVSSPLHKAAGVAIIFLGVVVAWIATVYVRNLLFRAQLLAPVAALGATLRGLNATLVGNHTGIETPYTTARIAEQKAALDADLEAQGLPPKIPAPYTVPGASGIDTYRQYVQNVGNWTAVLGAIVPALMHVLSHWTAGLDPAKLKVVTDAVSQLDGLAVPGAPPAVDDVRKSVNGILSNFDAAIAAASATGRGVVAGHGLPASEVPVREIRVEMASLGLVAWVLVAIVTTLVGAYVLVFSSPGFGTWLDFVGAFFWGLGLPAASQLASATSSTVSTAFKVTS